MKNSNSETTRLQRVIAIVLTAVFIPCILAAGVYGMITGWPEIAESIRFYRAKSFLADPDDVSFFPMTNARIQSLQTAMGESIPFKAELGYINAAFQHSLGKDMTMAGSEQLLKMDNGQIYALCTRESLAKEAQEVVDFYNRLEGAIPFLFSYVHPQFYEGISEIPEGFRALDTGDELADEVLSIVREAGIPALDTRGFFAQSGYTENELMLKTDMHWTTLAAILTAQRYAQEINSMLGTELDVSRLALDQFETEVHEDLFLGEYGQQIGEALSGLDDITFYWPKYETGLSRYTINRDRTEEEVSGDFREAIIRPSALDREPDGTNIRGYTAYGLTERLDVLTNHGECEDLKILMFKDSYSAPVGCFLSLLVKEVVMVDMRSSDLSAMDYVEQYDPDIILFSHSRQMYEDHTYELEAAAQEEA